MKEHLHLFTHTEDGLPEHGITTIWTNINEPEQDLIGYIDKDHNGEVFVPFVNDPYKIKYYFTHWLDLSKLATKERTEFYAEQSAQEYANWLSNQVIGGRGYVKLWNDFKEFKAAWL